MSNLDRIRVRLLNWARWAQSGWPDLSSGEPKWAEEWRPWHAWETGWGDPIPYEGDSSIDERDAERIDKGVMSLPTRYALIIKHKFYSNPRRVMHCREDVDEACMALHYLVGD